MYCSNCGAKNDEKAKFCIACGLPLAELRQDPVISNATPKEKDLNQVSSNGIPVTNPKNKAPKKKKKTGKIVATVIAIILVVVIGGLTYMATHDPPWAEPASVSSPTKPTTNYTTTTELTTNDLPTREEYMAMCKTVDYKDIERNPSAYEGIDVKFTGQVIQVSEEDDGTTYRISVTKDEYGDYDDPVLVYYEREDGETRVLEDDIVTFYGECRGVYTYESVMGGQITIPAVYALIVEIED